MDLLVAPSHTKWSKAIYINKIDVLAFILIGAPTIENWTTFSPVCMSLSGDRGDTIGKREQKTLIALFPSLFGVNGRRDVAIDCGAAQFQSFLALATMCGGER